MYVPRQSRCFQCKGKTLSLLALFSEKGKPHGRSGHSSSYSADCLSICSACGHGLIERYSHDCWSPDEPWDMWWWWVVDPVSVALLQAAPAGEDLLRGLQVGHAYLPGARERARRARAHHDGARIALSDGEPGLVEMDPRPVHPPTPPRAVTYYIAGARPLKDLVTASGGRMVLKMCWETGTFEEGLEYVHNIERDHETEQVSEEAFIAQVEAHRAKLAHPDGPLAALYTLSLSLTDPELLRALRHKTYALFQEQHPDPSFP